MAAVRINARLDEESAEHLEIIRQAIGAATVTDALKYSLQEVAGRLRLQKSNGAKMKALLATDFIGCANGPEDLSENYKEILESEWAEKHGVG